MCVCGRSLRGPPGKDAQDPTKFAQPLGEASCSPCTAQGRGHTDGSWQVCVCVCVDTLAQLGHSCRTGHLLQKRWDSATLPLGTENFFSKLQSLCALFSTLLFLLRLQKKLLVAQGKREPQNLEPNKPVALSGSLNFSEPQFPDLKMRKMIKTTAQIFKNTFYIRIDLGLQKSC